MFTKKVLKINKEEKKVSELSQFKFGAETAFPSASRFETFVLLLRLVFELELFKPPIGISAFGSETRITQPIVPKICKKQALYLPYLRPGSHDQVFCTISGINCVKRRANP